MTAATTNTAFAAFNVAETNPFRFSSEYSDDTLGLVYYNYRHYNPIDGRWLNRDCLQEMGGFNLYVFTDNSVPMRMDVRGLRSFTIEIRLSSQAIRIIRDVSEKINAAKEKIRQAVACMDSIRRAFERKADGMYDKLNHCIASCEIAKRRAFERKADGMYDKLNHCIASCEIANDCSLEIAEALGVIKEIRDLYAGNVEWGLSWILPKEWEEELHELIQGGDFEASSADFMANLAGFGCRNSSEGCECCCNMQHGVSYE
ncbi:MAG: RHS repeat-associated core domain-containing protein [Kiritimatiellae bacterium]|nr:RHS repeat-associated core domain-containing protein [Kiritimatiellia bacterium]